MRKKKTPAALFLTPPGSSQQISFRVPHLLGRGMKRAGRVRHRLLAAFHKVCLPPGPLDPPPTLWRDSAWSSTACTFSLPWGLIAGFHFGGFAFHAVLLCSRIK